MMVWYGYHETMMPVKDGPIYLNEKGVGGLACL